MIIFCRFSKASPPQSQLATKKIISGQQLQKCLIYPSTVRMPSPSVSIMSIKITQYRVQNYY